MSNQDPPSPSPDPLISVILPVLSDFPEAERLLARLTPDPRVELIVVDGGHDRSLERLVRSRSGERLIRSQPGRAIQMNAGAALARGEWLLFLHADSTLPDNWADLFERETGDARGGWFRFALDDPSWQARAIERGVALRVRLLRLPYGDQGLFVRRAVFVALGGYKEMPLMEDVEFVRRLVSGGAVVELPAALMTSARRWRRDGWLRRSARNLLLVMLYAAGVSPHRLARLY
jgi:rSAM/selenodomain-associated transferase 2